LNRIIIEKALEKLEKLYSDWGIPSEKWRLQLGWALRLQGYQVTKDMEILDTEVVRDAWPWPMKEEHERVAGLFMVPPADSEAVKELVEFTKKTGYGLATHVVKKKFFSKAVTKYRLPNGRTIYLNTILATVRLSDFLANYKREIGEPEDAVHHFKYIPKIKKIAERKGDTKIARECEAIIQKHSKVSIL